jgi:NADP-dependent 3-hydroxy acid dehydrogenase YdfG
LRLKDNVGVTTQAGGGIGMATPSRFAEEKAKVIRVDMDEEPGRRALGKVM